MSPTRHTPTGIAYDRAGPAGAPPVVLLHAGVADRRMWDPLWDSLAHERDVVRLDLRGFGESVERPVGGLSPLADVMDTLTDLGIIRCHLIGASLGAGVAVEAAVTRSGLVASLLLCAPGGSLIAGFTPDLTTFVEAERAALAADDLDAAVEANLRWWVDSPHRQGPAVAAHVRTQVGRMQRRAFEVQADWDDIEETELDPPALDRLGEISCPTTVLVGGFDLDAIQEAAHAVVAGVTGARRVDWPDTAHLPSLERPDDFAALVRQVIA